MLDNFLNTLADQTADRIMESLASRLQAWGEGQPAKASQALKGSSNSANIGTLADQLYEALAGFLSQSPEDRDRLMARYGKKNFGRVYSLLRDFSEPREERETLLKLNYPERRE